MLHQSITFGLFFLLAGTSVKSQVTHSVDKDWKKQSALLLHTEEADGIVRLGDIDNLGFGWADSFDPFCSRTTDAHEYPWQPQPDDIPGMDRILLSSKFKPSSPGGCGGDGYSGTFDPAKSRPQVFRLPLEGIKGIVIKNAYLQVFIDDFQAPTFCSRFQVTLNGKRFSEAEKLINAIDQTGPVGKLISIPVPEEFFQELQSKPDLSVFIDESKGAADGFAIDFVRLLINRKMEYVCRGQVRGQVLDKETMMPISGASVTISDKSSATTDTEGRFQFAAVPTGYEVFVAAYPGYNDGATAGDVGKGDENPEVVILLEKGKQVRFANRDLRVGESVSLQTILFDQGKADLRPESIPELDKLLSFMKTNPSAEIELSGHTSSEGDAAMNRSLSYRRVRSCKEYLVSKGIDPGRVIAIGYGPDKPVAPNDSETNRAKNRRVEMRVMKL